MVNHIGPTALMCVGLLLITMAIETVERSTQFRRRMFWSVRLNIEQSFALLYEAQKNTQREMLDKKRGIEEDLRAQVIKARREVERERRKDGEGWKGG